MKKLIAAAAAVAAIVGIVAVVRWKKDEAADSFEIVV